MARDCDITDCNYGPLLKVFEGMTREWMLNEVPWLGRIAAAKTVLFPKLMYLFRTIPRLLPRFYYTKFNQILICYVWKGAKPKIAWNTLSSSKTSGGVAFPDLEKYHIACLLNQARDWLILDSPKPWVSTERVATSLLTLPEVRFLPAAEIPSGSRFNRAIQATLSAWHKLAASSKETWLPVPVLSLKTLIPNL